MNRVVITGPESNGKTTLLESVKHLAEVEITEEFARYYLDASKGLISMKTFFVWLLDK